MEENISVTPGNEPVHLRRMCFIVDNLVFWTENGRKYLRHTRKRTRTLCETFGLSTILKKKEMITRQADSDKSIYLGTSHVLNFRPNT